MNQTLQLLTIQQVSSKLGVPKPTLRYWEKEFEGILVPLRTNGGQRRYSAANLSIVERIKVLKRKGLSLAEIKTALMDSQKDEVQNPAEVASLADRIAEIVRGEVHRFLIEGNGGISGETIMSKAFWKDFNRD